MTDSSGNQKYNTVKYLPFGACLQSPDIPTDKLFTSQRLDSIGLYYYNARYYDPTIGRFISPDTIIPDPANPQCFNRYSYCRNNPTSRIDPSGHDDAYDTYMALWGWASNHNDEIELFIKAIQWAEQLPPGTISPSAFGSPFPTYVQKLLTDNKGGTTTSKPTLPLGPKQQTISSPYLTNIPNPGSLTTKTSGSKVKKFFGSIIMVAGATVGLIGAIVGVAGVFTSE